MPKTKRNAIPDRWTEYTAVGKVVPGTRFIAFKVPLKDKYFREDFEGEKLTPTDLAKRLRGKVGMVLDLSKKTIGGYYSPEDMEEHGIEYVKLAVMGHHIPDEDVVQRFAEHVDYFEKNYPPEKYIGVHCTHGVNRTGYLIARYMVEHLQFSAEEALEAFKGARGYAIERDNYIAAIKEFEKSLFAWGGGAFGPQMRPIRPPPGTWPPENEWGPDGGPLGGEEWGPWSAPERGPWGPRGNWRGGMQRGGRPQRGSFNRGPYPVPPVGGPGRENWPEGPCPAGKRPGGPFPGDSRHNLRGGMSNGAGGPIKRQSIRGRRMNRVTPYGGPPMRGGRGDQGRFSWTGERGRGGGHMWNRGGRGHIHF